MIKCEVCKKPMAKGKILANTQRGFLLSEKDILFVCCGCADRWKKDYKETEKSQSWSKTDCQVLFIEMGCR